MNGEPVAIASRRGFVTLDRLFRPGDTLTLTLPMELARTAWPYGGIALERGPLVFSLPIQEDWTSFTVPDYSTPSFPGYNANPASAWNYAVVLDSGTLESQVKVQQATGVLADDPWLHPPVTLTVAARKVEDYTLQGNTNQDHQFFTPPLPDLAFSELSPEIEKIALVPYGSTRLRVTIFPEIKLPVKE